MGRVTSCRDCLELHAGCVCASVAHVLRVCSRLTSCFHVRRCIDLVLCNQRYSVLPSVFRLCCLLLPFVFCPSSFVCALLFLRRPNNFFVGRVRDDFKRRELLQAAGRLGNERDASGLVLCLERDFGCCGAPKDGLVAASAGVLHFGRRAGAVDRRWAHAEVRRSVTRARGQACSSPRFCYSWLDVYVVGTAGVTGLVSICPTCWMKCTTFPRCMVRCFCCFHALRGTQTHARRFWIPTCVVCA